MRDRAEEHNKDHIVAVDVAVAGGAFDGGDVSGGDSADDATAAECAVGVVATAAHSSNQQTYPDAMSEAGLCSRNRTATKVGSTNPATRSFHGVVLGAAAVAVVLYDESY